MYRTHSSFSDDKSLINITNNAFNIDIKRINMRYVFFILCFLSSLKLFPQSGFQWQKTIGGTNNDELSITLQTSDGGYLLGGWSNSDISGDKSENSRGAYDFWIVKTDSLGNVIWDKTIGGGVDDLLMSVEETMDHGFILGGRSESDSSGDKTENSRGVADYWIVKLSKMGVLEWQKTIGGNNDDLLNSISQTLDGGFIIGGFSYSNISGDKTENKIGGFDFWVVKLDSIGNISWQTTIGGTDNDLLTSVQQTKDSSYIVGGTSFSDISGDKTSNSFGGSDYWIIKLDQNGNIVWQKDFGGNNMDELLTFTLLQDGGYFMGGRSLSNISGIKTENCRGLFDYWLLNLDSSGNIRWQKTMGGNDQDFVSSAISNLNNEIIVGGYSSSNSSGDKTENSKGFEDFWVIKFDVSGIVIWQKTIGGNGDDELRAIGSNLSNNYLLGGSSLSAVSGDKSDNCIGGSDFWILKSDYNLQIDKISNKTIFEYYPNPASSFLILKFNDNRNGILSIHDIFGKLKYRTNINRKYNKIDLNEFASGFYFISFSSNGDLMESVPLIITK